MEDRDSSCASGHTSAEGQIKTNQLEVLQAEYNGVENDHNDALLEEARLVQESSERAVQTPS